VGPSRRSPLADRIGDRLGAVTRRVDRLRDRLPSGSRRRAVAAGAALVARGVWHVWRNRRYLTALKLLNMAAVNVQLRLRTERVLGRPYRLKIEPTNICNTECQLCPTGLGKRGRALGTMAFERFCALVDGMRRTLCTLDITMWGDPFIAPRIYDMVAHAHRRGIWTYLSSNLHGFRPERGDAERLLDSGLDMLAVSLHGASQQTFEAYQPGKDFAATAAKVRALVEARRRRGVRHPSIQLTFVVTRKNEHEREEFRRLAEELECTVYFHAPSLNLRFLDRDRHLRPLGLDAAELLARRAATLAEWLPSDPEFIREAYALMLDGSYDAQDFNGRKVSACDWPWQSSVINWDGSVVTCCGIFESSNDLGNVFERPFGEIWNSRAYRMARRSFKRPAPEPEGYANPCRECPGLLL
jgi:radical SAM protein with 4Fe4S-binding SPASM domain